MFLEFWQIFLPAIFVFLLSLWQPKFGAVIVLALLPSYLLRSSFLGIPTTLLELSIYALAAAFVIRKVTFLLRAKLRFTSMVVFETPFTKPLLLLFCAAAVGLLVSPDRRSALGYFKAYFFDALLFYFLLVNIFSIGNKLKASLPLSGLAFSGLAVALPAVFQGFSRIGLSSDGRAVAMFTNPNMVGLFLAPLTVFFGVLAFEKFKENKKTAAVLCSLFIVLLLAVVFSMSRGALLGILTGFIIYILYKAFKRNPGDLWCTLKKIVCSFVFLGSCCLLFFAVSPRSFNDPGVWERQAMWPKVLGMLSDRPIFGAGLAGFQNIIAAYVSANEVMNPASLHTHPHNIFLAFWSETGLLGLFTVAWIFYLIFRSNQFAAYAAQSVIALKIAFIAVLVHGFFDTPYFKNDLSILFMALLALFSIFTAPLPARNKDNENVKCF